MTNAPPGLVMWPADPTPRNRLCVLISDTHCTDCTVGNQTASENDWQLFFEQLLFACGRPGHSASAPDEGQYPEELILILNGDIVDLIRSGKWVEAGVYPWHRDDPRFAEIILQIMRDIVRIHADKRPASPAQPYSGFFYWLRQTVDTLRSKGVTVTIIPIVGNHEKELQVVPAARKIYYEECLGLQAADISQRYRNWVAEQLGTSSEDEYPLLPFYFVDHGLRLFATHGQWRDRDNSRATPGWAVAHGWQPKAWQREQYRAFSDPCFGDTIATGMLSHFIWNTVRSMPRETAGSLRLSRLLDEMDLYRPTMSAIVRLLKESRSLARQDATENGLHGHILQSFYSSLTAWLAHPVTWSSAQPMTRIGLHVIAAVSRLRRYWIDVTLMHLMASVQEPEAYIGTADLLKLPAFHRSCRALGLRLHVEGHTHAALEADVQFLTPQKHRSNYTYVNLGAWRDSIVDKRNRGFRRRGIGRALFIFDLAKLAQTSPRDGFRYCVRDMTSWGDRQDHW